MSSCLFLLPNQLIYDHPIYKKVDTIYLIEHPVLFTNKTRRRPYAKLNRLRCAYHRATEALWIEYHTKKYPTKQIIWKQLKSNDDTKSFLPTADELRRHKTALMFDPIDSDIVDELKQYIQSTSVKTAFHVISSPLFLFTNHDLEEFMKTKQKHDAKTVMKHASFYSWGRKRLSILLQKDGKMEGGKLSWDTANRSSLPISYIREDKVSDTSCHRMTPKRKQVIRDAWRWSCELFPNHYGPSIQTDIKDIYSRLKWFALDRRQARNILSDFISSKLPLFGTYQDAIAPPEYKQSLFLYHSNLSHCMNNGLLSPMIVLKEVEHWFYAKSDRSNHSLAQAEGFIRQVIGWREFCRLGAYKFRDYYWNANDLKATTRLNSSWYKGTTGSLPIDITTQKAFETGYLHHIERLMIMGNYMTLSGISPKQMYAWFMEFAMDSYDWVMIVNVFGMAAHADALQGPTFTKPYISSSNYVLKMSHYSKDTVWEKDWNSKYYAFLEKHQDIWSKNPRMTLMMRGLKKKKSV